MRRPWRALTRVGVAIGVIAFVVVALVPYWWMVLSSLKPTEDFFDFPIRYIPERWTLAHYVRVITSGYFTRSLLNSLAVCVSTVAVTLLVSVPAAYALARANLPGQGALLVGMLGLQFLPPVVLLVPLYIMLARFQLLDRLYAVQLVYPAFTIPFCVWMLFGFMASVPRELEEAAMVDGCGRRQVLVKVVAPVVAPGVISAGLYAFVWAWQEYLLAMVFLTRRWEQTAPVALTFFMGEMTTDWTGLMAASVLLTLPVLPVMLLSRYFQQGVATTGMGGW